VHEKQQSRFGEHISQVSTGLLRQQNLLNKKEERRLIQKTGGVKEPVRGKSIFGAVRGNMFASACGDSKKNDKLRTISIGRGLYNEKNSKRGDQGRRKGQQRGEQESHEK